MHVYQMRSTNSVIVQATEARIQTCMAALKDVSKVWLVAKMVHTLFESILGNKVLEERLQKAAGRRHHKSKSHSGHKSSVATSEVPTTTNPPSKRKFDDTDIGAFPNGAPAPQMSYERSRPQTPAQTPSRDLGPSQHQSHASQLPHMTGAPHAGTATAAAASSPPLPTRHDGISMFPTGSRATTRPTTPFYPGTPPDLFLVTRNSPTFSQDVWHNFQPDQLFPADTQLHFSSLSPQSQSAYLDPQLGGPAGPGINGAANTGLTPMMTSPGHPQGYYQQLPPRHHSVSHPNSMHPQAHPMQHSGSHGTPVTPGQVLPQSQPGGQHHSHGYAHHMNDPSGWAHVEAMNRVSHGNHRAEDTWSNSSMSQGPAVPTTLNVEDWYVVLCSCFVV